jgi:hypothetical protein
MKRETIYRIVAMTAAFLALSSAESRAHCDTMNGPVVKAAQLALDSRDVLYALVWVKPADEAEIRSAFERALSVRTLGADARLLADRYFFETLVRVHRAGEGASYTGLKEADVAPEPGIAAAELALGANSVKDLSNELTRTLQQQLEGAFRRVQNVRTFQPTDLEAGRRYVASYINYIHYVERLHEAIRSADGGHGASHEEHVH